MPGKSKAAEPVASFNDDAIRDRAYFLWEQDGRPDGRGEHYWHLAQAESHKAMVQDTVARTAKLTGGRNPLEMPAAVKASAKAAKDKVKVKVAEDAKAPRKAKAVEVKKTPKPRAALQKTP